MLMVMRIVMTLRGTRAPGLYGVEIVTVLRVTLAFSWGVDCCRGEG